MPETDGDRIPVGECPLCGYVTGKNVDVEFPTKAQCSCGEKLNRVTFADKETIMELKK